MATRHALLDVLKIDPPNLGPEQLYGGMSDIYDGGGSFRAASERCISRDRVHERHSDLLNFGVIHIAAAYGM